LKLKKEKSIAFFTQNEDLKKLIVKIGVNLEHRSVMQILLHGAKTEIQVLGKKLRLPAV